MTHEVFFEKNRADENVKRDQPAIDSIAVACVAGGARL
jgi:hypothetical protein